jgi:hypothetical protein
LIRESVQAPKPADLVYRQYQIRNQSQNLNRQIWYRQYQTRTCPEPLCQIWYRQYQTRTCPFPSSPTDLVLALPDQDLSRKVIPTDLIQAVPNQDMSRTIIKKFWYRPSKNLKPTDLVHAVSNQGMSRNIIQKVLVQAVQKLKTNRSGTGSTRPGPDRTHYTNISGTGSN